MAATLSQIDNNSAKKKYRKKNTRLGKNANGGRENSAMCNKPRKRPKNKISAISSGRNRRKQPQLVLLERKQKKDSKLHNEIDARNVQYTSTAGRCNRCKKQKKNTRKSQNLANSRGGVVASVVDLCEFSMDFS